ncbi:MAG: hypothetical protein WAW36_00530 [Methylovulum miyakonense]|uniref:hypothetical protein n=1 Tax=Methylovulum miyakonense TaxID=645578 RepID=UPI003BB62A76
MTQFKASLIAKLVLSAVVIFTAGSAIADKDNKNGHKGHHQEHNDQRNKSDDNHGRDGDEHNPGNRYFINDQHRTIVRDYYVNKYQSGRCPPGLVKKHNGCMPPGQAKRWVMGQPLPRDVVFYDLPPEMVTTLGPPPPGYRLVRVASDILLITIGTGIVTEVINNLGGY